MAGHIRFATWGAQGLALLALAGCGERPDGEAGRPSPLCAPIPAPRAQPAANAYEQAIQRDECIHRYAYLFAPTRDSAEAVVGAVIGACRAPIDRSATMLGNGDADAERWYLSEMERVARERALYRVIQARAGRCPS
jgi:hypothetical protein